jgi:hypothetical protein
MRHFLTFLPIFTSMATAHMQLFYPPPLKGFNNPHTIAGTADLENDFPYNCCGKPTVYPCRGHFNVLGTDEGQAVASWPAGSKQEFGLVGPRKYTASEAKEAC